jgi:tRNA threonylcarbamoyladenosine biosynthesis protein TsaE
MIDPTVLRSASREDTAALGERIAALLLPGDVVILSGELGAGKTALTRGLIAALGSPDPVTSPTFTIMRQHPLPSGGQVLHLDAYRLRSPDDAEGIGLLELLDGGAMAVIEWGERISSALGPDQLIVTLIHVDESPLTAAGKSTGYPTPEADDHIRMIEIRSIGDRWAGVDLAGALTC